MIACVWTGLHQRSESSGNWPWRCGQKDITHPQISQFGHQPLGLGVKMRLASRAHTEPSSCHRDERPLLHSWDPCQPLGHQEPAHLQAVSAHVEAGAGGRREAGGQRSRRAEAMSRWRGRSRRLAHTYKGWQGGPPSCRRQCTDRCSSRRVNRRRLCVNQP